ncbi:hypothetical protein ACW95P_04640 [Candidatus Mycoplasma pogonae]
MKKSKLLILSSSFITTLPVIALVACGEVVEKQPKLEPTPPVTPPTVAPTLNTNWITVLKKEASEKSATLVFQIVRENFEKLKNKKIIVKLKNKQTGTIEKSKNIELKNLENYFEFQNLKSNTKYDLTFNFENDTKTSSVFAFETEKQKEMMPKDEPKPVPNPSEPSKQPVDPIKPKPAPKQPEPPKQPTNPIKPETAPAKTSETPKQSTDTTKSETAPKPELPKILSLSKQGSAQLTFNDGSTRGVTYLEEPITFEAEKIKNENTLERFVKLAQEQFPSEKDEKKQIVLYIKKLLKDSEEAENPTKRKTLRNFTNFFASSIFTKIIESYEDFQAFKTKNKNAFFNKYDKDYFANDKYLLIYDINSFNELKIDDEIMYLKNGEEKDVDNKVFLNSYVQNKKDSNDADPKYLNKGMLIFELDNGDVLTKDKNGAKKSPNLDFIRI